MEKVGITNKIHGFAQEYLIRNNIELIQKSNEESLDDFANDKIALITMLSDKVDEQFLTQNSHLKCIANYAVGFNNINVDKAKELGIGVGNTPDVLTEATAELAFILMLNLLRKIPSASKNVIEGKWKDWEPLGFIGKRTSGLKIGIIGAGRIGVHFANLCKKAFNHEVYYYSRSKRIEFSAHYLELEELVNTCDIISIHCPLNDQTKNLINKELIKKFKKGSILINTARGEIHDEDALLYGLNQKILYGVGLDVTNPEPMLSSSPLLKQDNVIVTPHIGSATDWSRKEMAKMACDNILAALRGEQLPYSVY